MPDGQGGLTTTGLASFFAVDTGPCITSQGGRCVGRRYADYQPTNPRTDIYGRPLAVAWPSEGEFHGQETERCGIIVLGAGSLAAAPTFDTVRDHHQSALSALHSESVFYGGFVWARSAVLCMGA